MNERLEIALDWLKRATGIGYRCLPPIHQTEPFQRMQDATHEMRATAVLSRRSLRNEVNRTVRLYRSGWR